jgi:hypothetical protein
MTQDNASIPLENIHLLIYTVRVMQVMLDSDLAEIYHIGASLKDVGKKWFAFSKFETGALEMLQKLGGAK